jgi:translation elongation factor EF-Tu-like GTPase
MGCVDETVALHYPETMDKSHMVMPGDNVELICELLHPVAMDKGMRFTIRTNPPSHCGHGFSDGVQVRED